MNIDEEIKFDKFLSNDMHYVVGDKEEEILLARYLQEKGIDYINEYSLKDINYDYCCVVFSYIKNTNHYCIYTFDKYFRFSIPVINPSDILQNYYNNNNSSNKELLKWIKL